jgi:hypothetical protein
VREEAEEGTEKRAGSGLIVFLLGGSDGEPLFGPALHRGR